MFVEEEEDMNIKNVLGLGQANVGVGQLVRTVQRHTMRDSWHQEAGNVCIGPL